MIYTRKSKGKFRAKLILIEGQANDCNFIHFPCCEEFNKETDKPFPTSFAVRVIADLKQEFQKRFSDLDINSKEIRFFQNPLDCNVTENPSQFQMEIDDLQANDQIQDTRKETWSIFINIWMQKSLQI